MNLADVVLGISPLATAYVTHMQDLAIEEWRRKTEEQIASALGVSAELLFNPVIQRVLVGPVVCPDVDMRPHSIMRRKIRRAYGR